MRTGNGFVGLSKQSFVARVGLRQPPREPTNVATIALAQRGAERRPQEGADNDGAVRVGEGGCHQTDHDHVKGATLVALPTKSFLRPTVFPRHHSVCYRVPLTSLVKRRPQESVDNVLPESVKEGASGGSCWTRYTKSFLRTTVYVTQPPKQRVPLTSVVRRRPREGADP